MPCLAALVECGAEISCVLTQPDRPAGRGRTLTASPVKQAAAGLTVVQPQRLDDPAILETLGEPPDVLIVVAYGLILPQWMLEWARCGAVNVHASLLPRWRGAAPIQRAILAGDEQTGVSIMQMDKGLDTGPVYATAGVPIEPTTTATALHDTLAALGARTLIEVLPQILDGSAQAQPQDDSLACYAPKLQKSEARIDWRDAALAIDRQIRGLHGWPVAESHLDDGRRLRIWSADVGGATATTASPGSVLSADADGIVVATGRGTIRIRALQPPGGRVMEAGAWLAAHPLVNARFVSA